MTPLATTKTGRLEAFSDGVFAIAITLLILEIKIPSHEQVRQAGGLYDYLVALWPAYLSYFLSATLLGIYWVNHQWLFSFIERTPSPRSSSSSVCSCSSCCRPSPRSTTNDPGATPRGDDGVPRGGLPALEHFGA